MKRRSIFTAFLSAVVMLGFTTVASADEVSSYVGKFFKIQSRLHGAARSLEGNESGSSFKNGAAFFDTTQNVTGQAWTIEPVGDGSYRLKNQFRGEGENLECNGPDSPVKGGSAFMDKRQNVTGQHWLIVPAGEGYFRLHTKLFGTARSLEANGSESPVHNGCSFMDTTQNVTGQLFKFVVIQ